MSSHNVPRRTFLKLAALGGAGVALTDCSTGSAMLPSPASASATGTASGMGLKLGVASYSLRNFSRSWSTSSDVAPANDTQRHYRAQPTNSSDADNVPATITDPQIFNQDFSPSIIVDPRRRRRHP